MRQRFLFLLFTTILFASCSLISNQIDNTTNSELAVFTLNIGDNSRTITASEYTASDLKEIEVTFVDEETKREVTSVPANKPYSWKIPEGTYTVSVTAKVNDFTVAGSTSGVKVTRAEGGKATIRLYPVHDGTGNVEITFYYSNDNIMNINDNNPIETYEDNNLNYYVVELKSVTTGERYRLKLNSTRTAIIARNENPIPAGFYTLKFVNRFTSDVTRLCLPDNLVEIVNGNTTKTSFVISQLDTVQEDEIKPMVEIHVMYKQNETPYLCEAGETIDLTSLIGAGKKIESSEWKSQYEAPVIVNNKFIANYSGTLYIVSVEDIVEQLNFDTYYFNYRNGMLNDADAYYPAAKYVTYYSDAANLLADTNKQSQTVHDFSFDYKGNRLYLIETNRNQVGVRSKTSNNMGYLSFEAYDYGDEKIIAVGNINKVTAYGNTIYVATNDKIYYGNITNEESGTVELNEISQSFSTFNSLWLAAYNEGLIACYKEAERYYIQKYQKGSDSFIGIASYQYAENRYDHTISDMIIIGDKLYFLIKEQFADKAEHDNIASHGALFVLDLSDENSNVTKISNDITTSQLHYDLTESESNIHLLGPSRFLGTSANNDIITFYIADEGYYCTTIGGEISPSWSSRILSFTTQLGSTDQVTFKLCKVLSTDPAEKASHFEATYECRFEETTPSILQMSDSVMFD